MNPAKFGNLARAQALSPAKTTVLALFVVLTLGVVDYFTPPFMSLMALKMLVVGIVGWVCGRRHAWLVAVAAVATLNTVLWIRPGAQVTLDWVLIWNMVFQLVTFTGAGWLTAMLRKSTQALGASERKYRQLYETMSDAFASVSMDGRILEFNPAYQEMLGYTAEEMRQLTYIEVTPEKWHAAEARIVEEQIIGRGYSDVYEKEYRRKDGTVLPVEIRAALLRDEAGKPVAMWGLARDITERHRAAAALKQANDELERRVQERTAELEAAMTALRKSEERYRSLVNNLSVGVFRTAPGKDGGFLEANPALARIHGFESVDELMRRKVADLYLEPEERRAGMEELARTGQATGLELQLRRKDGQVVFAAVNATAHRGADGQVEWIDGVLEDVTERRRLERQILAISDEEQARIGHELHDGLCQQLIGLTFDANRLLEEAENRRPPDLKVAKRLAEGLDGAITEARQLSRGLFPVRLEGAGLLSALEELASRTAKRFGIACQFEAGTELSLPSKTVATQLYRIAQEALSNAARHSGGKSIRLRLAAEPGGLVLRVRDDGSGFNPSQESPGMGLHIIRYRARSIGAKLDVTTSSGTGTEVRVRVPLR